MRRAPSKRPPRGRCSSSHLALDRQKPATRCRRRRARALPPPGAAARGAGAPHVLTAHTLDDQAETVLLRMARGSGLSGLGAMARQTQLPITGLSPAGLHRTRATDNKTGIVLVRPLLDLPKARLIATLAAMGISYSDDPSKPRSALHEAAAARADARACG